MAINEGNVRDAGQLLQVLEDGALKDDFSERYRALIATLERHAEATGKAKGRMVLKLDFEMDAIGRVDVKSDLSVTEPKPARVRTALWVCKDGILSSENPKQTKLELREVPAPKPAREVGVAAKGGAE